MASHENTPADSAQQPNVGAQHGLPGTLRVVTKALVAFKFQYGPHVWEGLSSRESINEFLHRYSLFRARREKLQIKLASDGYVPPSAKAERIVTGIFLDVYLPSVRFRSTQSNVAIYEHTETMMVSFPEIGVFSVGNLIFNTPCVVSEAPSAMDPAEMDKLFERLDINGQDPAG